MLCKMPRSSTKGDVQKWNEWNFPLRAWPPKVATIPLFIHIGVNKKVLETSTIFIKPVPKYNGFILLLSSALISEYFIVKDQSLLNFSFNLTMKWETFPECKAVLPHLKPVFEGEPAEGVYEGLPLLPVGRVVHRRQVARQSTPSTQETL